MTTVIERLRGAIIVYLRKKLKPTASRATRDAAYEAALKQWKELQKRISEIEKALNIAGLYAMEHADGTFSIENK